MKPWRAAKILALILAFQGLAGSGGFAAVAVDNTVKFDRVLSKWIVQTDGTWVVEAEVTIRPPPENPSRVVVVPLIWSDSTERHARQRGVFLRLADVRRARLHGARHVSYTKSIRAAE